MSRTKISLTRIIVVSGRVNVHAQTADGGAGELVGSDPFVLRVVGAVEGRAADAAVDFLTEQYAARGYVVFVKVRSARLVSGDRGWILVRGVW